MAKVLVIDDDEVILDVVTLMLGQEGLEVVTARNGKDGLRAFDTTIDLVVTDVIMPEKEGLETIMSLRKQNPDLPIICISGGGRNTPQSYLKIAEQLGANSIMAKPFARLDFVNEVKRLLQRQ